MIITQTPLRISFAGGGTDFPDYYQHSGGAVLSSAIDKYIYVIVKQRFDRKIRVGYTLTEMVDSVDELEHELAREALRKVGIEHGVEISTMADIPSEGSGLGSSSAVTVGLLHALYAFRGQLVTPERLAEEACEIEIDILKKPIGKQDQYIAAFGGLRQIDFHADSSVSVQWVAIPEEQRRWFGESLLLFYTGVTRKADTILQAQQDNISSKRAVLDQMKQQVSEVAAALQNQQRQEIGMILNTAWEQKKQLARAISNPEIDAMYQCALNAGALGGKVAGAGGGGFLLLYCSPEKQPEVRRALAEKHEMRELPFALERDGTKVILNVRR
jgi:D-glycero-alpha-D-manno-heptose-7-phosphate kinase